MSRKTHEAVPTQNGLTINFVFISTTCITIFMLLYTPFIFGHFVNPIARLFAEGALICVLASNSVARLRVLNELLLIIPYALIVALIVIFGPTSFVELLSQFNKFLILLLVIDLFVKERFSLESFKKAWINISIILAGLTLVTFVTFHLNLADFSAYDLAQESGGGFQNSYYYLNGGLLGNVSPATFMGLKIGRVAGFLLEPSYLAVLFGFNIILSREWLGDTAKSRQFVLLNLCAAVCTFSTSFFLFFVGYFAFSLSRRSSKASLAHRIFFIAFGFFLFAIFSAAISATAYLDQTSLSIRIQNFLALADSFTSNTLNTLLFGNGISFTLEKYGFGIDSSWVALLLERGLFLSLFLVSVFYFFTRHNTWLMFYVGYINLALPALFWPVLLVLIASSYSAAKKSEARSIRVGLQAKRNQ